MESVFADRMTHYRPECQRGDPAAGSDTVTVQTPLSRPKAENHYRATWNSIR
jgi:hypothetical protein